MKKLFILLTFIYVLLACNLPGPTPPTTHTALSSLPAPQLSTATPTPGAEIPAQSTRSPESIPTVISTLTAANPAPFVNRVQIGLIALEDNGKSGKKIGCGDSLVMVSVNIPATQAPIKAAYEYLLSIKEPFYGESGLYNALYQSNLKVDNVSIKNGIAEVYLTGEVLLGGTCDNPRVLAQVEKIATQFEGITEVRVMINGEPLKEILSEK